MKNTKKLYINLGLVDTDYQSVDTNNVEKIKSNPKKAAFEYRGLAKHLLVPNGSEGSEEYFEAIQDVLIAVKGEGEYYSNLDEYGGVAWDEVEVLEATPEEEGILRKYINK